MESTLRQRAILAAQIKKRNDDEAQRGRWAGFFQFSIDQFRTALTDFGLDAPNIATKERADNLTLSYTEDSITFSTEWRYCKYVTAGRADTFGKYPEQMDGDNPLTKTLIAVPCATCGEMMGLDEINLLAADAFVQLGLLIETDQFCSAECEMKANGHEQFISDMAVA